MEFWAEIWRKMSTLRVLLSTGMSKQSRKRRKTASWNRGQVCRTAPFWITVKIQWLRALARSRGQQLKLKVLLYLENKVYRSLNSYPARHTNWMNKGSNRTNGSSVTSIEVFSPVDFRPGHASHLGSQVNIGVTNEDLVMKLCANGSEVSKLSQCVDEQCAALFLL